MELSTILVISSSVELGLCLKWDLLVGFGRVDFSAFHRFYGKNTHTHVRARARAHIHTHTHTYIHTLILYHEEQGYRTGISFKTICVLDKKVSMCLAINRHEVHTCWQKEKTKPFPTTGSEKTGDWLAILTQIVPKTHLHEMTKNYTQHRPAPIRLYKWLDYLPLLEALTSPNEETPKISTTPVFDPDHSLLPGAQWNLLSPSGTSPTPSPHRTSPRSSP